MIGETAQELVSLARSATDATGYFAAMYARVTVGIGESIKRGQFQDGALMDTFASKFANYYTSLWRADAHRPRCWQGTWDVARDPNLLIVQHLLLGINAHVNYDLPQAVVDAAREHGDLERLRPDFDTVNDVLANSYRAVLVDLDRVSRWMNAAATFGGGQLFNFSLHVARDQAWKAAERLWALDAEPARRHYLEELDALVSVVAHLVTRPTAPARPALWLARKLENRDAKAVIAALLGRG